MEAPRIMVLSTSKKAAVVGSGSAIGTATAAAAATSPAISASSRRRSSRLIAPQLNRHVRVKSVYVALAECDALSWRDRARGHRSRLIGRSQPVDIAEIAVGLFLVFHVHLGQHSLDLVVLLLDETLELS